MLYKSLRFVFSIFFSKSFIEFNFLIEFLNSLLTVDTLLESPKRLSITLLILSLTSLALFTAPLINETSSKYSTLYEPEEPEISYSIE